MANSTLMKLLEIQQRLNAPKDQAASGLRYKYRKVEDIIERVKPIMKDVKCVLIMTDDVETIGDRFYLKAIATLFDAETGDLIATNAALAREPERNAAMSEFQVTGSASSYARKYALCGLFAIDNGEKDPDELEPAPTAAKKKGLGDTLRAMLKKDGIDPDKFSEFGWGCKFSKVPEEVVKNAIDNYPAYLKQYKQSQEEIPF